MRQFYDDSPDRLSIIEKYNLSPSQRTNARYNEEKIKAEIRKITQEYNEKKQIIDAIHNDKTHIITRSDNHLIHAWDTYHVMPEDAQSLLSKQEKGRRLLKITKQYMKERIEEEKSDDSGLADALPQYLEIYEKSLELSLKSIELTQKLADLNLCQQQHNYYNQQLDNLAKSIQCAADHSTALTSQAESAYTASNSFVQAWNDWVDPKKYHQRARRFKTNLLDLEKVIVDLKKQQPIVLHDARIQNPKRYEAQSAIINTLTEVYENIDRLSQDATTAKDRHFQIDMAKKFREIEQHCWQLPGSGSAVLQYISVFFWCLTAAVVLATILALSLYLSGNAVAAGLVVSALTAVHIYPALVSLAAMIGCSMTVLTPVALGVGAGLVTASTYGFFGRMGRDKNLLSRSARQASSLFLEDIPQASQFDSLSC